MKSYQKTKPIRLKGKKLTDLFQSVVDRDEVCKSPFCQSGWPLDLPHHIKYKSQGGSDTEENLILLCCECHRMVHHTARLKITGVYPNVEYEYFSEWIKI